MKRPCYMHDSFSCRIWQLSYWMKRVFIEAFEPIAQILKKYVDK
jgi:hypothetical protein